MKNYPQLNCNFGDFKITSSAVLNSSGGYLCDGSIFSINPNWAQGNKDFYALVDNAIQLKLRHLKTEIFTEGELGFACNLWDGNYQHFIIESFPKICVLYDLGIRAIVFDRPFIRDLCSSVFPNNDFLFLSESQYINYSGPLFTVESIFRNFSDLPKYLVKSLKFLRESIAINAPHQLIEEKKSDFFYLGRLDLPSNVGNTRICNNSNAVNSLLEKYRFNFFSMEGLTFFQKYEILKGKRKILSPIGANLINLILAEDGANICVIGHPQLNQYSWFERLLKYVNPTLGLSLFDNVQVVGDLKENAPYLVDIDKLDNLLVNFIK
ncbi:glycosyltransferase family 61 protein [Polynucleobacter paneuropaeus]|nr:glycosyltransferase family 61 protein [Polynucleobacter paneuropaeus]MBT8638556.1 glycosyltransferase family 61 protein [Polynucleobacter paneuropaeus]